MAEKLTKKEKGFADDYIETGNGTKSVLKHYDTESENVAGAIASQNLRKLKIQQYIEEHAEKAESMIYNLSQNAEAETVRLNASKDILDRAGFKPATDSEKPINILIPVLVKFLNGKEGNNHRDTGGVSETI